MEQAHILGKKPFVYFYCCSKWHAFQSCGRSDSHRKPEHYFVLRIQHQSWYQQHCHVGSRQKTSYTLNHACTMNTYFRIRSSYAGVNVIIPDYGLRVFIPKNRGYSRVAANRLLLGVPTLEIDLEIGL